tara:strand:- start:4883 stop:6064 length:1182 start_codon:yes stop_codon:yes gene_type:complete
MTKNIFLLGSTGSIGTSTINVLRKDKKTFKLKLLTTNNNISKIYEQAKEFKVKKVIIFNKEKKNYLIKKFKKKKIKIYHSINDAFKNNKSKSFLTINAISGIDGLEPSVDIIKYSNNLAIANKESIICGWKFIKQELTKNKAGFIPLDSEHFSIWSLLKKEKKINIDKIYLTASGGPFLNKKLENIKDIKPKFALDHPNWKMGNKISIDSATMMNKIFEIIEAIKIFDINRKKFKILIHPKSYIHAIIHFKNGLTKLLAHDTTMEIPIANALYSIKGEYKLEKSNFNFNKLNGSNFAKPDSKNFPLLKILNYDFKNTYFEIILVSINDRLVKDYLESKISYIDIHKNMLKLIKKPYFLKYYNQKPKNIIDIKNMVDIVNQYLNKYFKLNDKFN